MKSLNALASEKDARIERRPGVVEVWMNVVRSHFTPDIVTAKVGDKIIVHLTNAEQTPDATHGFAVPTKNVMVSLDPGETTTVEFVADKPGHLQLLLHRVLLGAAPRDAGLADRREVGASDVHNSQLPTPTQGAWWH